jgi:hypothetical protein
MTPMADPDPLEELRAEVRAAQEAAQRLTSGAVPPRGWEAPGEPRVPGVCAEIEALGGLVSGLGDVVSPQRRQQLSDLLRQLLLAARALVDAGVARLESAATTASGADAAPADRDRDIPIS